ncbi:MAG: metalloregulator ArsR/SmtB family transcription factor [Chloroflexi bacterium]|nr:metalloregulator ArsR/SmtB family transcription factor [Chloroflexota bacterium]
MDRFSVGTSSVCSVSCQHPGLVERVSAGLASPEVYERLGTLFDALADPSRMKMLHALLCEELCSCDLAAIAGVTKSGASQHLRVLRTLGLVRAQRAGKFVRYRLDDDHVALLLRVGLAHLGHQLSDLAEEKEAESVVKRVPV